MHALKKPHRKTASLVIPRAKSKLNLQSQLPNIYLESKVHKKQKSILTKKLSLASNMFIYEPHTFTAKNTLRQAIKKHLDLKHVNHTYSRFLSQELVKAVEEDVQAIYYHDEKCSSIVSLVQEVFGRETAVGDREVLVAEGKITKKIYVFFTSSFYRPYSYCCQSVTYICIYNPRQVMEILTHVKLPSEFMIDFVCSKCHKRVLRLHRKAPNPRRLQTILTNTRQNNLLRSQTKPVLPSLLNESRHKISTTIMIASGRYKKIRINQSVLERKDRHSHGYKDLINTSMRDREKSLIITHHERKKLHRIKSQVIEEPLIEKQKLI